MSVIVCPLCSRGWSTFDGDGLFTHLHSCHLNSVALDPHFTRLLRSYALNYITISRSYFNDTTFDSVCSICSAVQTSAGRRYQGWSQHSGSDTRTTARKLSISAARHHVLEHVSSSLNQCSACDYFAWSDLEVLKHIKCESPRLKHLTLEELITRGHVKQLRHLKMALLHGGHQLDALCDFECQLKQRETQMLDCINSLPVGALRCGDGDDDTDSLHQNGRQVFTIPEKFFPLAAFSSFIGRYREFFSAMGHTSAFLRLVKAASRYDLAVCYRELLRVDDQCRSPVPTPTIVSLLKATTASHGVILLVQNLPDVCFSSFIEIIREHHMDILLHSHSCHMMANILSSNQVNSDLHHRIATALLDHADVLRNLDRIEYKGKLIFAVSTMPNSLPDSIIKHVTETIHQYRKPHTISVVSGVTRAASTLSSQVRVAVLELLVDRGNRLLEDTLMVYPIEMLLFTSPNVSRPLREYVLRQFEKFTATGHQNHTIVLTCAISKASAHEIDRLTDRIFPCEHSASSIDHLLRMVSGLYGGRVFVQLAQRASTLETVKRMAWQVSCAKRLQTGCLIRFNFLERRLIEEISIREAYSREKELDRRHI